MSEVWALNIEALRLHIADMDNVTLRAKVVAKPVEGGARILVTGEGSFADSIRRMVLAHSATVDGPGGWRLVGVEQPGGAALTVTSKNLADGTRIRGLGFTSVMTRGMHHQHHHLMLAKGLDPHR